VFSDGRINAGRACSSLARAIHRIAQRDGISVATVVKRLLQDALAAEGELELTPRPKPKRVFERITTIADDAC
jgi:hypothetical protein